MRNKNLISALFVLVPFISLSQEKTIQVKSKIENVIVFLQGAQVERTAQINIPTGNSTLVLESLSAEIDEQSIQVKGTGSFTILSVNKQSNFLKEQKFSENIQSLEKQISGIENQIQVKQNSLQVLKKEEEILSNNQMIGNGGAGLDLNKLKAVLQFQKSRLTEIKQEELIINNEIENLFEKIQNLKNQVNELKGKGRGNTSDIAIKVSSKSPSNGNFLITYLVKNARWFPTYDLRASDINKPIKLVYRANISQNSGEEWNNVKLLLSTGDPSNSVNKPSLRPYQIGYNIPSYQSSANITAVSGVITDENGSALPGVSIKIQGSSIGTSSDVNGNYSILIPSQNSIIEYNYIGYNSQSNPVNSPVANIRMIPNTQQLSEVVVTGKLSGKAQGLNIRGYNVKNTNVPLNVDVLQNQTTVEFKVDQPYTISSEGKLLSVEIANYELATNYKYFAVPKLKNEAYLSAEITGVNDLNLLSGEANLFFNGSFLGKTLINMENANDTLSVSLGPDKNVLVNRTKEKGQNEKSFIGSNQRATRAFTFDLINKKTISVKLIIQDQVPVSTTADVSIENLVLSGAKLDEATGMITWEVDLLPNQTKQLRMKYEVKYPKSKPLILE